MNGSSPNWIQKAINPKHRGAFTEKAEEAGEGVQQYAQSVSAQPDEHDTTTVRQANLAKVLKGITSKLRKPHGG